MRRIVSPWLVVLLAHCIYLGAVLAQNGGSPLAFARIGETVCTGYDGQFTYFIAVNPTPAVAHRLDVPAYRFQRILLPLLARVLALGRADLIPWTIPLINLAAQTIGTLAVERLLAAMGVSRWHALVFGLFPGLAVAVRANLTEPLSYALVAWAYNLSGIDRTEHRGGQLWLSAGLMGLAVFAKETALLFVAAQLAHALFARNYKQLIALAACAVIPFAAWQWAIWQMFGSAGIGSGGCLATPFELVPFNGLWRVAQYGPTLFAVFLLIMLPSVVAPTVWGIIAAARDFFRRRWTPAMWALGANATIVLFTPFSTFREPVAMMRFIAGLMLATLLYAGLVKSRRILGYAMFWLALLALLIKD